MSEWHVEDSVEDDDEIRLITKTRVTNPGMFQPQHEIAFDTCGLDDDQLEEIRATFRLFAASEDLLAACKTAVSVMERLDTLRHLVAEFPPLDLARAAISKAEWPLPAPPVCSVKEEK